jgi:integrase/recombinase XerD
VTFDEVVRSRRIRELARLGPLGPHLAGLIDAISTLGFTPTSLKDLVHGAIRFGTFLRSTRRVVAARDITQADVDAFVASQPTYVCHGKYRTWSGAGVRGARHVMRYLRARGITPTEPTPPAPAYQPLLDEWLTFLRHHRGLSPRSLCIYRRHLTRFLQTLGAEGTADGLSRLQPPRVRDFVTVVAARLSRSEKISQVVVLRMFLRFAWDRGYLSRDLSVFVERVPCFKGERLPRGPQWQDALRLLSSADRRTAIGRRDYAVVVVLMTYGVRAGQVGALRLDDVDWTREVIRFKAAKLGRSLDLPLVAEVGAAILAYLKDGRHSSSGRALFTSTDPPFTALTRTAIYYIVRRAFIRAGVTSPHFGSHALRHAWATRMLREGRSLKVISDLMGHRNIETSLVYAKVDYSRLRAVALPWPKAGGR